MRQAPDRGRAQQQGRRCAPRHRVLLPQESDCVDKVLLRVQVSGHQRPGRGCVSLVLERGPAHPDETHDHVVRLLRLAPVA
uniref:Uncharacterized protein n=1 Tax=Anopheles atroparvus TaxID=41427 RepID=A0AAG5DF54_ANOAO